MSAYFHNTLLPGASASDVCDAICRWSLAEGFQQESGRILFQYEYAPDERRVFVIWNEKWCVVVHSDGFERASDLRAALKDFPVVVQLWAKKGDWGYRLEENGSRITSYCSKRGLEHGGEPRAGSRSDLSRLVTACGIPEALSKLRRLEKLRFVIKQRACDGFAQILGVPAGLLRFHDLDGANAGIPEERQIMGWKCRMLTFRRSQDKPTVRGVEGLMASLTAAERAQLARQQKSIRKWTLWAKWLLMPMLAPVMLLGVLLVIPAIAVMVGAMLIGNKFLPRAVFQGKAGRFCEDYVKKLGIAEPTRIRIEGETVLNTRHGCSIVVPSPAKALPDPRPMKGPQIDEIVFDVDVGDSHVSCVAYPHGREPKRMADNIVETRSISNVECEIRFEKRLARSTRRRRFQYKWTLDAPRAIYQFYCSHDGELAPRKLEALEQIVSSFKFQTINL